MTYTITEHVATISTSGSWALELNLVSWDGRAPKYDLRKWSADHSKMSKGITLTEDELAGLLTAITPLLNTEF